MHNLLSQQFCDRFSNKMITRLSLFAESVTDKV